MVVFFGNELCLGIILACWLIGIALGAAIGGQITKKTTITYCTFTICLIITCLLPFIQIFCIRLIREVLLIPPGEYISLLFLITSAFILIVPFSFMIGLIFPTGCELLGLQGRNKAQSIGWVYIAEATGSLLGGVILTFSMIHFMRPYEILALISLLILLLCVVLSFTVQPKKKLFTASASLLLLVTSLYLLFSGHIAKLDDLLVMKRWDTYKNHLKMSVSLNSRYQNIVVAMQNDQYSLFGNGQYIESFPDPFQAASFAHFILSQHPSPRTILLIGGGATGIIHEMLKHPLQLLHYVELDPKLIEASLPFLSEQDRAALEDKRVEIFYTDGRHFLNTTRVNYDLVVVNLPDPSTANLNRFYTLEFFKEVQEKLNEGGVMVTGITSSVNYLGEEVGIYASSLYHTLKKVFPFIVVSPGTENYFFATSKPNIISPNSEVLAERFKSRDIHSDFFTPYHFKLLLPEDRVEFITRVLEEKQTERINTDSFPITYFYNLVLWEIISGERGKATFLQNLSLNVRWIVVLLFCLFFLRIAYVLIRRDRLAHHLKCNALLAIGTTGFAGMALEIILLFAFQNIYGYLYYKVGLIVALFMLGLSLGGWVMTRLIAGRERNWIILLTILEFIVVIYSLSLPYIIATFSTYGSDMIHMEYLFMVLVAGAGWLTGLEFPLVSKILIKREDVGTVAGWVDSFDHLGACCGALLTGTVMVPLFGTQQSCLITGLLNGMSGVLLLLYLVQKGR